MKFDTFARLTTGLLVALIVVQLLTLGAIATLPDREAVAAKPPTPIPEVSRPPTPVATPEPLPVVRYVGFRVYDPVYVALEQGFFEARGVRVELAGDVLGGPTAIQAVAGGRIVALSTPFGKRGWWFKEWAEGGEGWHRIEVPATECPRISAEFLAEERRSLGDFWFEQEYMCKFLDALTATFTYEEVQLMFREEVETWSLI